MPPRINIPPLTRGLLTALVAFSLLDASARYRSWSPDRSASAFSRQYYAPYLTLVPGASITYPWVLLTATFAEQNIAGLFTTGASLYFGGRYLERAWSSREYLKFMLIISTIPNVISFIIYIGLYALTKNENLTTTSISGGIAIQAGFLVAFKQLVPEHTVTLAKGILSMRVKHFPAVFLAANTISGLAFSTDTAMLLAWIGFLAAWIYLRFYRISPSIAGDVVGSGSTLPFRGDASDTFAFASFFPDVIQPPISVAADAIYNILVTFRICTPFSSDDIDAGNAEANARAGSLPSITNPSGSLGSSGGAGRREEAERRRALALRALDQRLQAGAGSGGAKQPQTTLGAVAMSATASGSGPSPLGETMYDPEPEPSRPRSTEGAR